MRRAPKELGREAHLPDRTPAVPARREMAAQLARAELVELAVERERRQRPGVVARHSDALG